MKYCGPWKEEKQDFWVLRDLNGKMMGIACGRNYVGPRGAPIVWWADDHTTLEQAKIEVEKHFSDWVVLKDEKLLVLL